VYPRTNFPDIPKKAVLRTKVGSLLIIPRDSGFLPRFYIKLPKGTTQKEVILDNLQFTGCRVFRSYK
jgi:phenol 2-monooxygenase (NADPH)